MRYQINSTGNIIIADQAFMDAQYPNDYTLLPEPAPTPEPPPVWTWYTDLGPFYDRFGVAKMAVLTSPDAGVQAIVRDCNIRKWIDLQNPEVAQSLAYIGTKVASVTPALQAAIVSVVPTPEENFALRTIYFS